jgi:hypothetical protein
MLPYVEPRMFITRLMKSDDPGRREAGWQIRTILAGPDDSGRIVVPALVIISEGVKATRWNPPGPVAIDPFSDHLAN